MKTLKCDLCEVVATGETFEDWMMALMPHYMEAHGDVMTAKGENGAEQMKVEKEKWMSENKKRFDES